MIQTHTRSDGQIYNIHHLQFGGQTRTFDEYVCVANFVLFLSKLLAINGQRK